MTPQFLGIDIGFVHTGVVVAELLGDGCYKPVGCDYCKTERVGVKGAVRVADSDVQRCQQVFRFLESAVWSSDAKAVIIELPHGGAQSARGARCTGMATGLAAALAEICAKRVQECLFVTPDAVKKALMNRGNASKDEIMARVRQLWPNMEWPDTKKAFEHVADAMGALQVVRHDGIYRRWAPDLVPRRETK